MARTGEGLQMKVESIGLAHPITFTARAVPGCDGMTASDESDDLGNGSSNTESEVDAGRSPLGGPG